MNRACPRGLKRPLEKFDSARLSRKKMQANFEFVNRRKILLKGYNFKESKHDRFGKRPAANAAEKIDKRSTEADVHMSAFRRSIGLFFFFFLRSSKNFRFGFLALNVSSQYFTWKISICSAKSNHVLRCSLSGELATGRARLRTGDRVAASQLQLTFKQLFFKCGLRAQARKSELKSSSGPAILLDMQLGDELKGNIRNDTVKWRRRSSQSVTASDFGSNGLRFESGRGRCVESLDKALYSHCLKKKPSH